MPSYARGLMINSKLAMTMKKQKRAFKFIVVIAGLNRNLLAERF
jgi:hypothetical protein